MTVRDGTPYRVTPSVTTHQTLARSVKFATPSEESNDYSVIIDEYILNSSAPRTWKSYMEYGDGLMDNRTDGTYTISISSTNTGNFFDGVVPYCAWKGVIPPGAPGWEGHQGHESGPQDALFFVEIYNDYMCRRGWAPYDASLDGEPGSNWPGFITCYYAFSQKNSVPPNWQTILKSLWAYSLKRGYGRFSFDYYPVAKPLPYRKSPKYEHDEHHEIVATTDPPITAGYEEDEDPEPYINEPTFPLPSAAPRGNGSFENYNVFAAWDAQYSDNEPKPVTASGGQFTQHLIDAPYDVIDDVMRRSVNVSGLLYRVSNVVNGLNVFEVYFNARDQYNADYESFGKNITGTNTWTYRSKWLYITVDNPSAYNVSDWLAVPNEDRCFAGVAWDGTGINKGEYLQSARGIQAWGSAQFDTTTVCKSVTSDPTSEFDGVLRLAKANVYQATGRDQCPFTWHSTKGYITWHVAM